MSISLSLLLNYTASPPLAGVTLCYHRSMATDGVTKVGHHSKCGAASVDILPHVHEFFGQPDADVQERHILGTLNLISSMVPLGVGIEASVTAGRTAALEEEPACTASLSCSRPESKARGPCDIHGLVGGVCAHTVPLMGSFIDMHTPEQFVYYLIQLEFMVSKVPELRDVYIDFGCRLAITWARYVAVHRVPGAERIRIMVNWMHARGHEEACEAFKSARHFLDAARRGGGENAEQLWSMLKVRIGAS